MASIAYSADTDRGEVRFFFSMACLMAAIIVAGFAFNVITGRSSFGAPWLVHFHAWVMMGWVGIYLAQNTLVFADNLALHRRLGWISVVWLPMILIMGVLITLFTLRTRGGPPFFDQNQFLFSNPLQLVGSVALAASAVLLRRKTAWHRRLMLCGFAMLTGPGLGRLLPSPLLIPNAWYIDSILPPIVLAMIGMLADGRRYGRAHPAWLVGIVTVIALQIVADTIAYSDLGIAATQQLLSGTPGAARPMAAFMPAA
jgi:hypothetical protein